MRKRSISESSQGHSSSRTTTFQQSKPRKTTISVTRPDFSKKIRRKSHNSSEAAKSSQVALSNDDDIFDDWRIIVQSMKENNNSSSKTRESASKPSQRPLVKTPNKKVKKESPLHHIKDNRLVDKKSCLIESKTISPAAAVKSRKSKSITPQKKDKSDSKESESSDSWKRPTRSTIKAFEPENNPKSSCPNKLELASETIVKSPNKVARVNGNLSCGEWKVELTRLSPDKDDELDFVGFGSSAKEKQSVLAMKELIKREVGLQSPETSSPKSDPSAHQEPLPTPMHVVDIECKLTPPTEEVPSCDEVIKEEDASQKQSDEKGSLVDSDSECNSFLGFVENDNDGLICPTCSLVFSECASFRHHRKFGHQRIYSCPFDVGQCGQFKGSIELHHHVTEYHDQLFRFLTKHILADVSTGVLSSLPQDERACSVCQMMLREPEHSLHELCVHNVWPKSLLSFSSAYIEQLTRVWWTGKCMAYNCQLCDSSTGTTQYQTCSPIHFGSSVRDHMASHSVVVSFMQCWWLLFRLMMSVSGNTRRVLNALLSVGIGKLYGVCVLCKLDLEPYKKSNLKLPNALCHRCEYRFNSSHDCWFSCGETVPANASLLDHMLSQHPNAIGRSIYCIKCGDCVSNIFSHITRCKASGSKCKFCNVSMSTYSILQMIYHTLQTHTFQCPLPDCVMPLVQQNNRTFHRVLPTANDLSKHIFCQHLPQMNSYGIQKVSNLLSSSQFGQTSCKPFMSALVSGTWVGMKDQRFSMVNGTLLALDHLEIKHQCFVCQKSRPLHLSPSVRSPTALCRECTRGFVQCAGGDLTPQCPVYTCQQNLLSEIQLVDHLVTKHGLARELSHSCNICVGSNQASGLGVMIHKILTHRHACLICPYYSTTSSEVDAHRKTEHGLPNWKLLYHFFKRKTSSNGGVVSGGGGVASVWSDLSTRVYADWDQTFSCSKAMAAHSTNDNYTVMHSVLPKQAVDTGESGWCFSVTDKVTTAPPSLTETIKGEAHTPNHVAFCDNDQDMQETPCEKPTNNGLSHTETFCGFASDQSVHSKLESAHGHLNGNAGDGFNSPLTTPHSHANKKKKLTKGMGENACIDQVLVANNILVDLEQKFMSTCTSCSLSVSFLSLGQHLQDSHALCEVRCQCGFRGELFSYLVHSFHMSHSPCEAWPITIATPQDTRSQTLIVLEKRPNNGTNSKIPCYKCGKTFSSEKSRQLHYNLCKLEKKFQCDICDQNFGLLSHLKKHKEWKHNPQKCKHCSKDFTSSSSLHQHMVHIHKSEANVSCKVCNESFASSAQLKAHSKEHIRNQPLHSCKLCPAQFVSEHLYQEHMATEHQSLHTNTPTRRKRQPNKFNDDFIYSDSSTHKTSRVKNKRASILSNTHAYGDRDSTSESDVLRSPVHKRAKLHEKRPVAAPTPDQGLAITLPSIRPEMQRQIQLKVDTMCNPCRQQFDDPIGKLLHMYLLHPAMVLSQGFLDCAFCHYRFRNPDDVSDHHLDKHQRHFLADGTFSCLCGMNFKEEGAYYFHLYYAHKAQRALNVGGTIVCRVCTHRPKLDKIVDLVVHLSDRHTMFDHVRYNDAYMCNFCYKAFETWTVLSLHFFMVHKATKSQTLSYDCPYCKGASPWHSLEALQYHLDGFHAGQYTKAQPVSQHTPNIYTPAPIPASPTKPHHPPIPSLKIKKPQKLIKKIKKPISSGGGDALYCICQCPYDEVSDMIGCDNQNCRYQWFHFECVGIMAAPAGKWFCTDCETIAQNAHSPIHSPAPSYSAPLRITYTMDPSLKRPTVSSSSSGSSSSSSSNSSSSGSSSSDSSSDSEPN